VKRVLFDENMPRKLRRDLPQCVVRTVQEQGWAGLRNGLLLRRASAEFDVFVTADQNLRHQQNVAQFTIAVVVIETVDTTVSNLRKMLPQLKAAIEHAAGGTVSIVIPPE
jgi:predicted nuclease of predicted toxin-antitoxin system